jgi:hypothetical protein
MEPTAGQDASRLAWEYLYVIAYFGGKQGEFYVF